MGHIIYWGFFYLGPLFMETPMCQTTTASRTCSKAPSTCVIYMGPEVDV